VRVLYFAWLRARVGAAEEQVQPPAHVQDVQGLLDWLRSRSPGHAQALKEMSVIRVAVNQEYVPLHHPVKPGDEIAIFPPVTGG
jgi:molybdopterin synthase sulfur carrier subunit